MTTTSTSPRVPASSRRWRCSLALAFAGVVAGYGYNNDSACMSRTYGAEQVSPHGSATADASAGSSPLKWILPAGWKEVPAGQMRVASFLVEGKTPQRADVSVVPLPGLAGGDLENVNRWRSQVGQPALKAGDLDKTAESVEIGGQPAKLFDQAGAALDSDAKIRILAAVLHRDGVAWFFKMTGDDKLVSGQKPAFIAFLKSLQFTDAPPASQSSADTQLPPGHPPLTGVATSSPSVPVSSSVKPVWQVPANWQEASAGSFLIAKYQISGPQKSQATVNVSMSAGDGGGMLANVNRWRGQLGLAPTGEADLIKTARSLDVAGGKATIIDMSGVDAQTQQKTRLLGAVVSQPKRIWFYKLIGSDQLVAHESAAFTKFVQNVRYPNAQ